MLLVRLCRLQAPRQWVSKRIEDKATPWSALPLGKIVVAFSLSLAPAITGRYDPTLPETTFEEPTPRTTERSIAGSGPGFRELESQFPDYDCATLIADPSAFALQLGKDIGRQFDMEEVQLSGIDIPKQIMLTQAKITAEGHLLQKGLDTTVMVSHGPVSYCDPPEMIINRLPIASRGAAVPFVKRIKFAGHREYRFVIEFIGEPRKKVFLMEITNELRSLAHTLT